MVYINDTIPFCSALVNVQEHFAEHFSVRMGVILINYSFVPYKALALLRRNSAMF